MKDSLIRRMVQVGTVSDVNTAGDRARVLLRASGMTTDWLYILQHPGAALTLADDGGHGHDVTIPGIGAGTAAPVADHDLTGSVLAKWTPAIGETVLVLFLPVEDGDGFILGRIG